MVTIPIWLFTLVATLGVSSLGMMFRFWAKFARLADRVSNLDERQDRVEDEQRTHMAYITDIEREIALANQREHFNQEGKTPPPRPIPSRVDRRLEETARHRIPKRRDDDSDG